MVEYIVATPLILGINDYKPVLGVSHMKSGFNRDAVEDGVRNYNDDELVSVIMHELDILAREDNQGNASCFAYEVEPVREYSGRTYEDRKKSREGSVAQFIAQIRGGETADYIAVVAKILSSVNKSRQFRRKR